MDSQLVERAARMTESSTADHRHAQAPSGGDRRHDQRGLVPDAARRVFVHFAAGQIGEIQDLAGMQHGVGQGGDFGSGHPPPKNRHQPSGHLIIGNFPARIGLD